MKEKFANFYGYTDVKAYEIVKVVSDKTLEIRRLKATLLNGFQSGELDALKSYAGGFFANVQGVQRYSFESRPDEFDIKRIRLGKKGWKDAAGAGVYVLSDHPYEFYDYNF